MFISNDPRTQQIETLLYRINRQFARAKADGRSNRMSTLIHRSGVLSRAFLERRNSEY